MRYKSGRDFRQALETRLRNESLRTGAPLVRLRKMAAFERLLARLARAHYQATYRKIPPLSLLALIQSLDVEDG